MNSRRQKKAQFKAHSSEIRFLLLFVLFFMVGQSVHFLTQSYTTPFYVHKLNAEMSSTIINTITPDENTVAKAAEIKSDDVFMTIEQGCEGIEGIILLIAVILAVYTSRKNKFIGILFGSIVLYFCNLTRIVSLYYVIKYKPELFDVMHVFVGQTFIIFISLLLFIFWINIMVKNNNMVKHA